MRNAVTKVVVGVFALLLVAKTAYLEWVLAAGQFSQANAADAVECGLCWALVLGGLVAAVVRRA